MYKKRLLFFGIPKEINEDYINEVLKKKGCDIVKSKWEEHERMEYLAINVKNEIQYEEIGNENIELKV